MKANRREPVGYSVVCGGAGYLAYNGRKLVWETNDYSSMKQWFHSQGMFCPSVEPFRIFFVR